jgi:hypothetical protein
MTKWPGHLSGTGEFRMSAPGLGFGTSEARKY